MNWDEIPEVQGWAWVFFSTKGRLERKRYIIGSFLILAIIIGMWVSIFLLIEGVDANIGLATFLIAAGITLLTAWPTVAMAMKRLKDMDEEPMLAVVFILVQLVPCVGGLIQLCMWIWMMAAEGTIGPNQYGPSPFDRINRLDLQ